MTEVANSPTPEFDVAIIGGGAAGVLVAIHLLHASNGALRLAIVEPREALGLGVAYSTTYPEHLLNVIASRMSAFQGDPGHFLRFLESEQYQTNEIPLAHRFVGRRDFGRYLRATLAAQPGADSVHWLREEAVALTPGTVPSITLQSGLHVRARSVVLAIGNFARGVPLPSTAVQGNPHILAAWDYDAVQSIPANADVCIIGSGLSMVDAVISLASRQHRGAITVISRHGLMPLPHALSGLQEGEVNELLQMGVRQRFRAIRARAKLAQRAGEPWQWTMDRLRPHVEALWTSLSHGEQRRFLRHAARYWDIHRHRIAPSVAQQLDRLRDTGQLQVRAGSLASIARNEGRTEVRFRPRGDSAEHIVRADHVINSTGMESNIARMPGALIASLRNQGLVSSGPHGIGIATDRAGAALDAQGDSRMDLLAIGALRVGQLWESIAIPELRKQAQAIAESILEARDQSNTSS